MAVQLNIKRIFLTPLGPKSLAFGRLANRAVALIAVFSVKLMPFFAVSFARVKSGDRNAILQRIFARCNSLQMLWVNASTIAADVIDNQPLANLAFGKKPSDAMRSTPLPPQVKSSVSIPVQRALPNMALAFGFPLFVEPINLSHDTSCKVSKATRSTRARQHALV